MATVTLTKGNFEEVTSQGTVFIDFWAAWCLPCQRFAPIYDEVAEANPDIFFAKVDVDAQPELAAGFDIRSVPTLLVIRDRIRVFARAGALPGDVLQELAEAVRTLDMDLIREGLAQQAH
ncbi:MAG: thioredoxin family protein [Actinomycetota bacterium]|nr:thioredoxin family protein [Actinomycetota bacterium]